jgi:uncharacterized protein (DUF2164 family)
MNVELSNEERAQAIGAIKTYFRDERDEDLGDLAAGLVLDFFLGTLSTVVYNRAIADAEEWFTHRCTDLQSDLAALKKRDR